jgi:hypothetical protein
VPALLAPAPLAAQQAPAAGAPFSAFGYGETDLRGGVGRADIFFALPPDRAPGGETLVDLDISHSPLLLGSSTLTLLAGGVSVASVRLDATNTSHGRVAARVPAELFGGNGLALSVRTYLRLTADECEDPANPALWATVHATSAVALGTRPVARDLTDAPELVAGRRPGTPVGAGVGLALPASPDAQVLRAAGVVAAQVGRWQADQRQDALVGLAGAGPGMDVEGRPTVTIAAGADTPAGFPATWSGGGYTVDGRTVPGDHGLVALAQEGPVRLLVGGATPAAVVEAAEALGDSLSGPVAAPTGGRAVPVVADANPWRDGAASFAQLGIDRQDLIGPGRREVTVQVDRPPGWTVKGKPTLDLVVDAGAGLDAGRSALEVQVAGVELGQRRLQPGGGPRAYRFEIPAGLLDRRLDGRAVRNLDVTVRMVLGVDQQPCRPVEVEGARATVLPTSAFRLPHDTFDGRELGRFPAGLNGPVSVVLPRSPDRGTLAAGLQLSAALGRWSEPGTPAPVLTTVDALTDADRQRGVILVGDADAQLLGAPLDLGQATVAVAPGQSSAVLGLVPSPFDEEQSALVVHGDAAGLLLAARTLASREALADLRGSRLALSGAAPAVTLADIDRPSPPPELAPVLGGESFVKDNSWAIPAIVVLAGFLVVLALVARYRWGRRRPPAA